MSIESINLWHSRARPTPDAAQFNVQLGCHLEEIVEMLGTFELESHLTNSVLQESVNNLDWLAKRLKANMSTATITDRKGFLDAIADQVVAGVGAAYCAGMNAPEAVRRVQGRQPSEHAPHPRSEHRHALMQLAWWRLSKFSMPRSAPAALFGPE